MFKFNIKIDTLWSIPLLLVGASQEKSFVEICDADLHIKMGVGDERIPFKNIASVTPHEWSLFYGIGHRIGYHGIGYVGSTEGVVHIKLKQPQPFNMLLGMTMEMPSFYVSLVEPQKFIEEISSRLD